MRVRIPHARRGLACGLALAAVLTLSSPAAAQSPAPPPPARPAGQVSFFTSTARVTSPDPGASFASSEFVTAASFGLKDAGGNGSDYFIDLRHAGSTVSGREARVSIYDAFVGRRFRAGTLAVRGGQMWIGDLGGLGAVAGGLAEYRPARPISALGRLRVTGLFGAEPTSHALGYVAGIRKFGGYATVDGAHGRKHVAGYVRLTHGGLTERSVVTFTNFLPVRSRLFLYQSGEYDLVGPARQGHGGLTYFFVNARVAASSRVDLQALMHRGRSIDTRAIADDVLNGRPIPAGAADGLLYESAGGRVSVTVARHVRANAGYTRDRNNHDSASTGRLTLGGSATGVAGTGVDLTVALSRITRPTGRFNSLYTSVGRQFGSSVYVSGDYASSVSLVRFTRSNGLTVEMRPSSHQVGASAVITLRRRFSLLVTGERTTDDTTTEMRVLSGLSYRWR
jgi:hypothetical protein